MFLVMRVNLTTLTLLLLLVHAHTHSHAHPPPHPPCFCHTSCTLVHNAIIQIDARRECVHACACVSVCVCNIPAASAVPHGKSTAQTKKKHSERTFLPKAAAIFWNIFQKKQKALCVTGVFFEKGATRSQGSLRVFCFSIGLRYSTFFCGRSRPALDPPTFLPIPLPLWGCCFFLVFTQSRGGGGVKEEEETTSFPPFSPPLCQTS